ncbi:GHKL domain-containing protein [Streptococcus pneumoniae]
MLDIDMLSEVGNGIVNSTFSLLALVLTVVMMKRWSLDLDLFFSDAFTTHYHKSFFIILPLTGFRIFSSFMTNRNSSFYVRFDTTISLLIFILFFSWLFYIKHLEQAYRDEQTIQRQEDENRSLQGMVDKLGHLYDEVRGFRHDFAGIVASMEPAIANQDMAEVSTIYQDVFLKTNEKLRKADYTAFNLHNIHDIAIRNTLAKAMIVADNQGIHFSLETVGVVEELDLPMLEAIRILSILTTNALEAASEAENPQIRVALLAGDRSVRFIIENTRKKEELNPSILSQRGYSTKGNHSGLGLATLEDMVFHYDLNLDTQLGETTFRQDLELPFKDEKRGGEE